MPPYSKILCATDFSECSSVALEHAHALARSLDAELVVLHVVQPMVILDDYAVPADLSLAYERAARENSARKLKPLVERMKTGGVKASWRVACDMPAEHVCALAAKEGFDLVVVGTRGLGGLKHLILGSTAERIVRHCPCPVLAVKARLTRADGAHARASRAGRPRPLRRR